MSRYLVVFVTDKESDLNFNLDDQFFTVRLSAKNAKDARHKAWRAVHGRPSCRWLIRYTWFIWNTGLVTENWPPGILRAEGLILRP